LSIYFQKQNTVLVRNFVHLSLLRGINLLSPFILYPYLIRVVGLEAFGHLTIAYSINSLLGMLGDYGFQQAAVREVAAHRNDRQRISNLYWTLIIAKPILILATAAIVFIVSYLLTRDYQLTLVYCSGVLLALSEATTPNWLFQGLEKMQNMVYANLVTRLIGLFLVILLIKQQSDYPFALLLIGVGAFVGALVSNLILVPQTRLILPFSEITLGFRRQMLAGAPFFLRSVAASFYTNVPVFILQAYVPAVVVGYFGVADRIVAMLKAFLSAFSSAIFPPLVAMHSGGHAGMVSYIQKYFRPYLLVVTIGSGLLFVFAPQIIALYSGTDPEPIVPVLRAMALLPISIALTQPMDALMQVYGREKLIGVLMLTIGVINLILNLFLIPHYQAVGAGLALFIAETVLVFLCLWFFERKYRDEAYFMIGK
jgi:polysaccharide transporter, PST family